MLVKNYSSDQMYFPVFIGEFLFVLERYILGYSYRLFMAR
jgi:hypothetical protein